jgi:hypothetical protein
MVQGELARIIRRRQIVTFALSCLPIYDECLPGLWSDPGAELAVAI